MKVEFILSGVACGYGIRQNSDLIQPGAFSRELAQDNVCEIHFDHGKQSFGHAVLRDTPEALLISHGALTLDDANPAELEIIREINIGARRALSIGYAVTQSDGHDPRRVREALLDEVSLCCEGANYLARVQTIEMRVLTAPKPHTAIEAARKPRTVGDQPAVVHTQEQKHMISKDEVRSLCKGIARVLKAQFKERLEPIYSRMNRDFPAQEERIRQLESRLAGFEKRAAGSDSRHDAHSRHLRSLEDKFGKLAHREDNAQ